MRVHLVRADEIHPGDTVVGTDQDGPYSDGPKTLHHAERVDRPDRPLLRLVWSDDTTAEYHPHATLLVDPNR